MENLLVLLIVFAAALGAGVSFLRKRKKGGSCASGCGGCSCAAKPAATPLVTLRR
jgi:hypothetical protein